MKHTVEVMISEDEIKARVAELGRQISERYRNSGKELVLVGLLRGSFILWPTCAARSAYRMKSTS